MMFGYTGVSTVNEKCSCGATFRYSGPFAGTAAHEWRTGHRHRVTAADPARQPTTTAATEESAK